MPFVQTAPDASLFYRDWGAGAPVLFCAAWALSSVAWQYQMMSVVDAGRRAVAYDRRGHDAPTTLDAGTTTTRSPRIWRG